MIGYVEGGCAAQALDGPLEARVLEGQDLAAGVADHVVVMMLVVGGLETGQALAEVEAGDQAERLELLEDPIDAGTRHRPAGPGLQRRLDLERGQPAALPGEQIDDRGARAAAAVPRIGKPFLRALGPVRMV